MGERNVENLLRQLSDAAAEPVRAELAESIKSRIPDHLGAHRHGLDTINIIIDLRISRLAAAAVILGVMLLFAVLLGGRQPASEGLVSELKYSLVAENAGKEQVLASMGKLYEYLARQGKDVTYYGDVVDTDDRDAMLMHWKLPDGSYKVIFGGYRLETVTSEELIRIQARMLRRKGE